MDFEDKDYIHYLYETSLRLKSKLESYSTDDIFSEHDQWLENREVLNYVDAFGKNNPNKSDYECYHTDLTVSELNNKIKIYSNYSWVIGFEVVKLESKVS